MLCITERLEDAAESAYYEMAQPGGNLKCGCGDIFNPEEEGRTVSANPYALPVCSKCFDEWLVQQKKNTHNKNIRRVAIFDPGIVKD